MQSNLKHQVIKGMQLSYAVTHIFWAKPGNPSMKRGRGGREGGREGGIEAGREGGREGRTGERQGGWQKGRGPNEAG